MEEDYIYEGPGDGTVEQELDPPLSSSYLQYQKEGGELSPIAWQEMQDAKDYDANSPASAGTGGGSDNGGSKPGESSTDSEGTGGGQQGGMSADLMGYDQQIAALKEAAARNAPETEKEKKQRERRERSKKIIAAVTDGIGALSNLYFTSQYAPNMYTHERQSVLTPLERKLEIAKAEREREADRHLQFALQLGNAQNQRAATVREMEAAAERRRLAREAAAREAEKQEWARALQPDKQREQAGKADKAENEAESARIKAIFEPHQQQAALDKTKAQTGAANASANASNASAAKYRAEAAAVNQYSAWDERGNEHKFKTEKAALAYAKQHGTYEERGVVETSVTDSELNGKSTQSKTRKLGFAGKPSPSGKPDPSED